MGNVRSLGNKTDKLAALIKTQREYRECSVWCFTETWLHSHNSHMGVDDTVIYLLQRTHLHLDGGGGTVRITFFDFSSAFNTIQPLLLGKKLRVMGADNTVISWITDYLTGRPQFVLTGNVLPVKGKGSGFCGDWGREHKCWIG